MAAGKDFCCRYFKGTAYIAKFSGATVNPNALLELGNATAFEITHENKEVSVPNHQTLGGTSCKIEYPESANVTITLSCIKARNLALALQGTGAIENIAAATITDEEHTVIEDCQLIPFNRVPDNTVAVTVTDAGAVTTYVEGTDFERTATGIVILEGGSIVAGIIEISYAHGKNTIIQALMSTTSLQTLIFDGYDYGEGSPVPIKLAIHKIKFGPTASWSIIGEEFQEVILTGEILRDDTKTGTDSPFYSVEAAEIK